MKYTRIPADTFQNIQLNAGILAESFDPETQVVDGILGATTGGINFVATPTYQDFGEDIDNCPTNTKELKKLTEWAATMAGTFVTVTLGLAKMLVAAADADNTGAVPKIVPRNDVLENDFKTLWFIGDYSDKNDGANAGFIAIKLLNALSTGGFQIQSNNKGKGNFAFTFTGHYTMAQQDVVPFEIYIAGGEEPTSYIALDKHSVTIEDGATATLFATVVPEDASITWTTASSSVATVSGGIVTGEGEGNTIITATITVDGVSYSDTCTVVVTAASA